MNIIYIFIILIIIFILIKNKSNFSNTNIKFYDIDNINKNVFKNYFDKCSINDLKLKTKSNNNFENVYFNRINKFSENEKNKIIKLVNKIDKQQIFKNKKWNFVKTKDLEFNFPRTLGQYIILPYNFNFSSETLIHERMHVSQRNNQEYYNQKYYKLFENYLFKIHEDNFNFTILDKNIRNPDADNNVWLINNKNQLYFIPYIYQSNDYITTNKAYLVINNNNIYTVTDNYINTKELDYSYFLKNKFNVENINLTHPNETYVDIFLYNYPSINYI